MPTLNQISLGVPACGDSPKVVGDVKSHRLNYYRTQKFDKSPLSSTAEIEHAEAYYRDYNGDAGDGQTAGKSASLKGVGITRGRANSANQRLYARRLKTRQAPTRTNVSVKPGIRVDTSVSRHRAVAPPLLYPLEDAPIRTTHVKLQEHHSRPYGVDSSTDSPITPAILVTPAREDDSANPRSTIRRRPRATSSIYSVNTAGFRINRPSDDVPPMPTFRHGDHIADSSAFGIPMATVSQKTNPRDSSTTVFEEESPERTRYRAESATTLFEEDDPSQANERRSRPGVGLTLDTTVPTPRRSRGWWNVITTPFELTRSASARWLATPTEGEATPIVPEIADKYRSPHDSLSDTETNFDSQRSSMNEKHATDFLCRTLDRSLPPTPIVYPDTRKATTAPPVATDRREDQANLDSRMSYISPHDREVPIVLGHDLKITLETRPAGDYSVPPPAQPAPRQQVVSLDSGRSEFSPVVDVAITGTRVAPGEIKAPTPPPPVRTFPAQPRRQELAGGISNCMSSSSHGVPSYISNSNSRASDTRSFGSNRREMRPYPAQYVIPIEDYQGLVRDAEREHQKATEKKKKKKRASRIPPIFPLRKQRKHETVKEKKRRRKKCCLIGCICFVLLGIIAAIIALVLTLTRRPAAQDLPVQSRWLNLTGFPPMPTGVMTVARPRLDSMVNGCVNPTLMWSCSLPREEHLSVAPNNPDEPNFHLEIRFNNGTGLKGTEMLSKRQSFSDTLFQPSPAPPSLEDQAFLGNTTDNNALPFEGEETPFYISFITAEQLVAQAGLVKRQGFDNGDISNTTSSTRATRTSSIPSRSSPTSAIDLGTAIPRPSVLPDGIAAPANLLPFPSAQPVRLYNRGRQTEHYGFYTYFSRSIFLKSVKFVNVSDPGLGEIAADENGGSTLEGANSRCTWAQTRFLVQIWTRADGAMRLMDPGVGAPTTQTNPSGSSDFSANDLTRPGSFPYPITITLDRHGGTVRDKMIFCYGLDARGRIVADSNKIQLELRTFGGALVNPSKGPFEFTKVGLAEGGPGGIDGGTGGCACRWANWVVDGR